MQGRMHDHGLVSVFQPILSNDAIVFQFSALATLLPPNFMTTQGDSRCPPVRPVRRRLRTQLRNRCCTHLTLFAYAIRQKKTRQVDLAGLLTMSELYISRYSCHSHPRTSGAPCIYCVLSRRIARGGGTIRGCLKKHRPSRADIIKRSSPSARYTRSHGGGIGNSTFRG